MTADIWNGTQGRKVIYDGVHGYEWQRKDAEAKGFVKGQAYTILRREVGSSSTNFFFKEHREGQDGFNSVLFKDPPKRLEDLTDDEIADFYFEHDHDAGPNDEELRLLRLIFQKLAAKNDMYLAEKAKWVSDGSRNRI